MAVALVSANTELNARIEAFVKAADQTTIDEWKERGYTFAPPPTHRADYISDKWVRVVTMEVQNDGTKKVQSVYAFIVLKDGQTKALGTLKAGDIHKPAGFKAPAKHSRGSVFQEDFGKCLTPYGIKYLS
jgi:hypothetical protein